MWNEGLAFSQGYRRRRYRVRPSPHSPSAPAEGISSPSAVSASRIAGGTVSNGRTRPLPRHRRRPIPLDPGVVRAALLVVQVATEDPDDLHCDPHQRRMPPTVRSKSRDVRSGDDTAPSASTSANSVSVNSRSAAVTTARFRSGKNSDSRKALSRVDTTTRNPGYAMRRATPDMPCGLNADGAGSSGHPTDPVGRVRVRPYPQSPPL